MWRYLAVIAGVCVVGLSLSSCGAVNPDPATVERRSAATVSGVGYDGLIAYGDVHVYAYKDGKKGAELATGKSDDAGRYALSLVAEDQPVLIEITGGRYKEEATGRTVNLKDGQALRAVTFYKSGQALNVMLTALTNLQAALVEFKVNNGTNIGNAIAESASAISTLLNFDVLATEPLDITDQANASLTLSNGHLAGFYAAAMSSWTKWASEQNGSVAHSIYNSIALTQIMYRDLATDGDLDGRAGGSPLGLGLVALSQDTYRQAFARHLLSMASDPANKTGITVDQLLAAASQLAGNTHPMFGEQPPTPLDDVGPEITGIEPPGVYHAGVFTYAVTATDFVGVQTVVFSLDEKKLDNAANVKAPQIAINSALYGDGAHKLTVSATDFLGNNTKREFTVLFDNSVPHIAVTSRPVTNKAVFSLSGTYTDSGAGIASIKAQGRDATVADGVWSVDVALKRGVNTIQVMLTDKVGNAYQTDTIVAMDITPPDFDIVAHSLAKFSQGDGAFFIDKLRSENDAGFPLYIPVSKVSLNGTLIDPNALNTAEIPYFTFTVGDRDDNGVLTQAKDLIVRIQYERGGNVVAPWHSLQSYRGNGLSYYIPISTESMAPGWESTSSVRHIFSVELEDAAGNTRQQTFSFFADIIVPPVTITATDLGAALFKATPFDKRGDLHNRSITTTDYSFTNDTGVGLLISLADDSKHSVTNTVDVAIREHLIKDVTTTEWHVKAPIQSIINGSTCTQSFEEKSVSSILNWNGGGMVNTSVPVPILSAPHAINSDAYPIPDISTPWSDVPHIDNNLFNMFIVPSKTTTVGSTVFGQDYGFVNSAGYTVYAFFQNSVFGPCPSTANWSYFKQRNVFSYISEAGYPRNNYTSQVDSANFQTAAFVVMDLVGTVIPSVGGYYRIPSNATIHIKKSVTTPSIAIYNDLDVATVATFSSYTAHMLDKTLTWIIDNNIVVKAVLDLGYSNASAMRGTPSTVVGKVNYTVAR